jgi:hypothetical protein
MIFIIRKIKHVDLINFDRSKVTRFQFLHPDGSIQSTPYYWEEDELDEFVLANKDLIEEEGQYYRVELMDNIDTIPLSQYDPNP